MKNSKGITLISLIVYIIVLLMVISIIATITTSMTTNLGAVEKSSKDVSKVNKFDMYFLSDIKNEGISIYDIKSNEYIILEDKNGEIIQYILKENAIYRLEEKNDTQIQICNEITGFEITKETNNKITIKIVVRENNYTSTKTYKIGKW